MSTSAKPRRTKTKAPGVYRSISGKFEIAFRDSDGRLRFQVVEGGFEAAKAARADVVGKVRKGEAVRPSRLTFGEYAEAWIAALNKRPRTLEAYRYQLDRHLLPRFRRRKLTEIATNDIAHMVVAMQRAGLSWVDDQRDAHDSVRADAEGEAGRADRREPGRRARARRTP